MGNTTYKANIDFYNDYYDKPRWWFKFRYDTQYKARSVFFALKKAGWLKSNLTILEIGFGSGEVLFRFDKTAKIHGLEISDFAVKAAERIAKKRGFSDFRFQKINDDSTERLPLQDAYFDVIIASHVIEHIETLDSLVEEIKRMLKPSGVFVVIVPINERYNDKKHVHKFSSESCRAYFDQHNFVCLLNYEDELLYHLVEDLYWRHCEKPWNLIDSLKRILFNIFFSQLPYYMYQWIEFFIKKTTKLKPRQSVLVLAKNLNI